MIYFMETYFNHCCDLNCILPNFQAESLTPNVTVFGHETFKEVKC